MGKYVINLNFGPSKNSGRTGRVRANPSSFIDNHTAT